MNLSPWLKFFRIGGITSALSAGIAGSIISQSNVLPSIITISSCALLYLLGMGSNDLIDFKKDIIYRPERPLPSKQISLSQAKLAMGAIALGIVSLSFFWKNEQTLFYLGSIVCILLYNGPCKTKFGLATTVIALARASNFIAAIGPNQMESTWVFPALAIAFHTTAIMFLAEGEDRDLQITNRHHILIALSSFPLIILTFQQGVFAFYVLPWLIFSLWSLRHFKSSDRNLRPKLVGAMVGAFTLLDATTLLCLGYPIWATIFLLIFWAGKHWSRRFPPG
jgi:4-hydroxybenzoate polyprenyltransferase